MFVLIKLDLICFTAHEIFPFNLQVDLFALRFQGCCLIISGKKKRGNMQRRTKEGGKGVGGERVPDVYLGERQLVFDDSLRLFIGALTSTPLLIDEEEEEAENIYDFLCHPVLFFCRHEVPAGRCLAAGERRGEGESWRGGSAIVLDRPHLRGDKQMVTKMCTNGSVCT